MLVDRHKDYSEILSVGTRIVEIYLLPCKWSWFCNSECGFSAFCWKFQTN